ncbi:hypothetical protein CVAR_2317 [Corynebacterium variabile DSM 44702]|uniref:Recombinase family protein n=1 Tax=Corynebacterium variabile (strain DSM 44702 / CIP 107183 / JCM 12073 / NCIMB 30131) TaxID=858619 RepID=G0HGQ5_CORVD|nr:recombinase family protein [Corynebacterium variabile]AEK37662.1 hypothetical protein CVAR_2317 [Corynebacterium variabile DSM 44702]
MASSNTGSSDAPDRPLRACAYARVSLDLKEGAGVDRQLKACRDLARLKGYDLLAEFVDNDRSAYSGKARPEYSRMIAGLKAGKYDRVLCFHTDRLARRTVDTLDLLNLLKSTGAKVEVVTGNGLDPSSSDGELLGTILAAISQAESRHKGERVRAAQEAAARAGKPRRGGNRTFGYEHGMAEFREDEAAWIREAARRVLAGESVRSICQDMDADGVKTTTGGIMRTGVLRATLTNPKIAGYATWNPRRADGRLVKSDRQIVGRGQWEPILDEDTFHAVEAVLRDPARATNHRGNQVRHLLSGIVRCGGCGRVMYINSRKTRDGKGRRYFYFCKGAQGDGSGARRGKGHYSRAREPLDAYVTETLLARLERDDVTELLARSTGAVDAVDDLTRRRDELRQRLASLDEQVAVGRLSVDRYTTVASRVEDQLASLDAELASHVVDTDGVLASLAEAPDVRMWWSDAPLDQRRALVDATMTVTVYAGMTGGRFDPDTVKIEWKV